MDRCPVCEMQLRPGMEAGSVVYQDRSYHFCSEDCRKSFQENPKQFIQQAQASGH